MTDENSGGNGSGFGWFLVGLGIGAAVGVLYAPAAGSDTRDTLSESAREQADILKQKSKAAASQVNTYVDLGKDQLNDYVERGKAAVGTAKSQVGTYVDTCTAGSMRSKPTRSRPLWMLARAPMWRRRRATEGQF